MDSVNKTLYIPLYAKAYVSSRGLFLSDPMAEKLWAQAAFPLKGKAKSRWLCYYLGIRAAVFDAWVRARLTEGAVVLHIGCGLDSRAARVAHGDVCWYDVDFPQVIAARREVYEQTPHYRMIPGDARKASWLAEIPETERAIVVMEGISMYLKNEEVRALLTALRQRFAHLDVLMDCYTPLAARLSKRGNPVKSVGVQEVWGVQRPEDLCVAGVEFACEHDMTPPALCAQLQGAEGAIFRRLYAGSFSKKLYRLFEYKS